MENAGLEVLKHFFLNIIVSIIDGRKNEKQTSVGVAQYSLLFSMERV